MMRNIVWILIFLFSLTNPVFAGRTYNPETYKGDYCITIEEEDGSPSNHTCSKLKVSNGTLTNNGDGTFSLTTGGGSGGTSGYDTIQEEGSSLTQQTTLNFIGSSITCVNDGANSRTNCTVTDNDTTYSAGGTLLDLTGTTFSINEGTLTDGKGCKYVTGTGLVCDQDYLTSYSETDPMFSAMDTEAELESQLTDVTDVYTNNDGNLTDDDLSDDSVGDLSDVTVTTPSSGQVLKYNGSAWVNDSDSDTTYSASGTLLGLSGTVFSVNEGTLTDGKGCKYVSGTGLVCDQDYITSEIDGDTTNELQDIFQNITDGTNTATADSTTDTLTMSAGSGISVSVDSSTDTVTITNTGDTNSSDDLTTSTSFSGDVTGAYNNLQLGSGVVGTTEIADGSVDISTDTNLSGGRSITLNGDAVDADSELYTDTKCIYIEDPTADDDLTSIWWTYKPVTITKIWCESDQTVNMDLQIDDGTPADVNGSDIACTSTPTTDSSLAGDTTMGQGDRLDLAITSVSGTPTWVSICWEVQYDD